MTTDAVDVEPVDALARARYLLGGSARIDRLAQASPEERARVVASGGGTAQRLAEEGARSAAQVASAEALTRLADAAERIEEHLRHIADCTYHGALLVQSRG